MAALASSSCITDPGGTGHSRPISIGLSRRNAPLIGLSAGTISVWNSTRLKRAGASTGCTSIAATETRAPNPLWRSCFRSLNSSSPKMCSRASGSQSPPKNRRPALSRYSYQSQPMSIAVTRTTTILKPDQSRVLLRPFIPGDSQRISRVITRIVSLPENQVGPLLEEVSAKFSQRHERITELFGERFEQLGELLLAAGRSPTNASC
jgi:hypothetical protein